MLEPRTAPVSVSASVSPDTNPKLKSKSNSKRTAADDDDACGDGDGDGYNSTLGSNSSSPRSMTVYDHAPDTIMTGGLGGCVELTKRVCKAKCPCVRGCVNVCVCVCACACACVRVRVRVRA
jgi:hypothetical protein